MSNNLVSSQQSSITGSQMAQLQPITSKLDSPMQMAFHHLGSNEASQQQVSSPTVRIGQMNSVSNNLGSQMVSISNNQTGHTEPQVYNMVPPQYLVPNKPPLREIGAMLHGIQPQQVSALSKRKAPLEPMLNNPVTQRLAMPNKRLAQAEHRPWLQQPTALNKRALQMQAISNFPGSQYTPPSKRPVPSRAVPSVSKTQPVQMQPSPKVKTESFESVRSKMREQLAAALALVSQKQAETSSTEKKTQSEVTTDPEKKQESSQPSDSNSIKSEVGSVSAELKVTVLSNPDDSARGNINDTAQTVKSDGQQFPSNLLPDEDVSFSENIFARDELLQGNGLSWVLEPEIVMAEKKEIKTIEHEKSGDDKESLENVQQSSQSPEVVAFKIEAELFKLFGGVNKKYKEKGRSLLFNLKDPNNPELRERVMSGDIIPARLCSMSAEELASKELSEWRQAKAEEFAQMVVLPDTEVDIRRLVKKTHKGEFQVEVDQADGASVEVSAGPSMRSSRPKTEAEHASRVHKTAGTKDDRNPTGKKSNLEDQNPSCTITIPSAEGSDLMQGLMVDDELKDTELPPIVSLDEFMQSLDSEPPFENLPVDAEKATPTSDKDDSEVGSESKSADRTLQDPLHASPGKPHKVDSRDLKADADTNSRETSVKTDTTDSVSSVMDENVWEGLLQLNISMMISVIGLFKSGEKTSTKEWPSVLEIKGRVKLDAFEKFLQELPMSRSRAVMVLHFACKEGSPKSERASLAEVAESYVLDGRVGFAESASGTELYFCPPHTKTLEMLSKILPKDQLEALNAIDNGLIGVVVWRRAQLISPNSTSHHKHSSKKQHFTPRRHQEKDTNMNANFVSKPIPPHGGPPGYSSKPLSVAADDDDDDVPPGFGPGAASRDEDDLPEFNFSGRSNPSGPHFPNRFPSQGPGMVPSHLRSHTQGRPVDQVRELIQKYGQTNGSASVGVTMQPWNDDDDDIPEWQPQTTQHQPLLPQSQVHRFQQMHRPQPMPAINLQGQQKAAQSWQQGSWWVHSPGPQGHQPVVNGGQFYGTPIGAGQPAWPQDAPKSRGF